MTDKSQFTQDDKAPVAGFPLARIKKIIKADNDITACSSEAAFLISAATVSVTHYRNCS